VNIQLKISSGFPNPVNMEIPFSDELRFCPSLAGIFGKPTKFLKLDTFTNSIKGIIK